MKKQLSISTIKTLLSEAVEAFPHEACETCECFLGYITHLSIESDQAGRELLESYQLRREDIHACLGCDPCPPGEYYAQYLQANRK
jgi:hypothetical protein